MKYFTVTFDNTYIEKQPATVDLDFFGEDKGYYLSDLEDVEALAIGVSTTLDDGHQTVRRIA